MATRRRSAWNAIQYNLQKRDRYFGFDGGGGDELFSPREAEPYETSAEARRAAEKRADGQRPRERPADGRPQRVERRTRSTSRDNGPVAKPAKPLVNSARHSRSWRPPGRRVVLTEVEERALTDGVAFRDPRDARQPEFDALASFVLATLPFCSIPAGVGPGESIVSLRQGERGGAMRIRRRLNRRSFPCGTVSGEGLVAGGALALLGGAPPRAGADRPLYGRHRQRQRLLCRQCRPWPRPGRQSFRPAGPAAAEPYRLFGQRQRRQRLIPPAVEGGAGRTTVSHRQRPRRSPMAMAGARSTAAAALCVPIRVARTAWLCTRYKNRLYRQCRFRRRPGPVQLWQ